MTDTVESVTRQIFEVVRGVAGPMFTEKGFLDVSAKFDAAQNLGTLLEAIDFAEVEVVCPEVVLAAFHDIKTACGRVLEVSKTGGMDLNKLGFAKLQALHAATLFQDARGGKLVFEEGKPN
jgi:hypothetical protein